MPFVEDNSGRNEFFLWVDEPKPLLSPKLLLPQYDVDNRGNVGDGNLVVIIDIGSRFIERTTGGLTQDAVYDGRNVGDGHLTVTVGITVERQGGYVETRGVEVSHAAREPIGDIVVLDGHVFFVVLIVKIECLPVNVAISAPLL